MDEAFAIARRIAEHAPLTSQANRTTIEQESDLQLQDYFRTNSSQFEILKIIIIHFLI